MEKLVSNESIERLHYILEKIKQTNNTGSVLEFGVYEGYSLSEMVKYIRKNNMKNKVYGFDGFIGLPREETNYYNGVATNQKWEKGKYCSSLENTKEKLKKELTTIDDIVLVEGIYEDVLSDELFKKLDIQSISLLHIDCDLVSSCNTVLNFCKNSLNPGTFVVFDEWTLGEDYCWKEFSRTNNIKYKEYPCKNSSKINYIIEIVED